jgi:hypoxanthine phosphoribosyltransferase
MSFDTQPAELAAVRANARCLASLADIRLACDAQAQEITLSLRDANPILLCVMTGGAVPLAMLLERLDFPLQVDYVHLTRYGLETSGGAITWIKRPPASVRNRTVLVVDDILDHGITLAALIEECRAMGAAKVLSAVLVTKTIADRAGLQRADFSALTLPDAYLFGCGMDYKSYLRNAPGIFAVGDTP